MFHLSEDGARKVILPSRYVQGPGVISQLGAYVRQYGRNPYAVGGRTGFSKVKARILASLLRSGVPLAGYDDSVVECTRAKISSVASRAEELEADVIIGCGGGKAVDVAKAAADRMRVPVITVPTQCATNADQMADAVIFTEEHRFVEDLYLSEAPVLVLVDTEVVASAPSHFLVQGMGDALACGFEKPAYAESQRTMRSMDMATQAALEVNLGCFRTLMEHGIDAKRDVEAGKVTDAVEAVVEAIKLQSGFGFGGGGCAAAHAVHNGLLVMPGIAKKHGEIVAFGTLVQMVLEERSMGEIERVVRWCRAVGLPTRTRDLGAMDMSFLPNACERACDPKDSMVNMPFEVTPGMVLEAIREVDRLADQIS